MRDEYNVERRTVERMTVTGFEPKQAEANGFQVHLLNHSDTLPELRNKMRHDKLKKSE